MKTKRITNTIVMLMVFFTIMLVMIPSSLADSLYEYQTTDNNQTGQYGVNWACMTYTVGTVGANVDHFVTSLEIKVLRQGSSPSGNFRVALRNTDGAGKPTGSDLAYNETPISSLSTSATAINFVLNTSYFVSASTKYAIVLSHVTGTYPNNYIMVRYYAGNPYSGGSHGSSSDSGSTWTMNTGADWYFKEYGFSNYEPSATVIYPTNQSVNISTTPICHIWANDSNPGDTLTVTWQSNISGSWVTKQVNTSVSPDSDVRWHYTDASVQWTKYYWRIFVDDGSANVSYTYYFTTMLYYMNVTLTDVFPNHNGTAYYIKDYNKFAYQLLACINCSYNFTFNKTCTQGFNTTDKIYFNNTLLKTHQCINQSYGINIFDNYSKIIYCDTIDSYQWWVNSTFYNLSVNNSFNIKFHINITNGTTCGNTSLTVYNNTNNVTGNYTAQYNSTTGWQIWMNFSGFGNGTGTGTYNVTINLLSGDGISFSVNWTGDYNSTDTNITFPVNRSMILNGLLEVLAMSISMDITQLGLVFLTLLMMFCIFIGYMMNNSTGGVFLIISCGFMFNLMMLVWIYFAGIFSVAMSPLFVAFMVLFAKDGAIRLKNTKNEKK